MSNMNETSKKEFKTDEKLLYIAVLIIFSNWVILNTEPEISMEDNLKFQKNTTNVLNRIEAKVDSINLKLNNEN